MFICQSCHSKTCTKCQMWGGRHFSGSYGPCEACSVTTECHDCHCDCELDPNRPRRKGYAHKAGQ